MIDFSYPHIFIGLAILIVILVFRWRQNRSFSYLFFFSFFWMYLLYVVSVIVFPFVILQNSPYGGVRLSLNLVPFYFGTCDMPELCYRNIVENILLSVPFGFGINFIARLKPRDFVWLSVLVGLIFEATQLIISLVFRSSFRAVDINDVILNAAGVLLGYGIFRIFGWLYLLITQRFEINNKYMFAYIHDVVRQSTHN